VSKILVIPGTNLVAKEVLESIKTDKALQVFGAGFDTAHPLVEEYVGYHFLPSFGSPDFVSELRKILAEGAFDFVLPAHDEALRQLLEIEWMLEGAVLLHPGATFTGLAVDKWATYQDLKHFLPVPFFSDARDGDKFFFNEVFVKPSRSQGGVSCQLFPTWSDAATSLGSLDELTPESWIASEFLPGREFTVDVFSLEHGGYEFLQMRERVKIIKGRAVSSILIEQIELLGPATEIARIVATRCKPVGAWFFQLKESKQGELNLVELGPRIGGGSALARARGINLTQLNFLLRKGNVTCPSPLRDVNSVYLGIDGNYYSNAIEMPDSVFVDLDDTLITPRMTPNTTLIKSLEHLALKGIPITIITRHIGDPTQAIAKLNLGFPWSLTHLKRQEGKSSSIRASNPQRALFIDDSFRERQDVERNVPGSLVVPPETFVMLTWLDFY
jgi:hypothetical protein